jgi:predicted dehydrogenase
MSGPVKVGIIGCGDVSDQYLRTLSGYPDVEVVALADLDTGRAEAKAATYGIASAGGSEELLADPGVELVVNLTVPAVHAEVGMAVVTAGKHLWSEKPITMDRESARALLEAADAAGVAVGNAPDTVLGTGIQTSHRLAGDGLIGTPQTVLTLMQGPGPDSWHPRPQFLFARGAGPLFDIGPYYFTTLAQMLGQIDSVEAIGHRARRERVVMTGPDAGTRFPVEVYTHVSVLTRFASGVAGTSVYSFDSPVRRQLFEITGSEGTMEVPVSGFDGPTRILRAGEGWEETAPSGSKRDRGVGVLEMARAVRAGASPRASGELAYHVLDAMLAVEESIEAGKPVAVSSRITNPSPLAPDWDPEVRTL